MLNTFYPILHVLHFSFSYSKPDNLLPKLIEY